jgi:hypothetical protein
MAEWTELGQVAELSEPPPMPPAAAAPPPAQVACAAPPAAAAAEASASDASNNKREKTRMRLTGEILETERAYVATLAALERVYIVPLRLVADQPKGAIFSHEDLDKIFLNLDTISHLSSKFLAELEEEAAGKEVKDMHFADIFGRYATKFHGQPAGPSNPRARRRAPLPCAPVPRRCARPPRAGATGGTRRTCRRRSST